MASRGSDTLSYCQNLGRVDGVPRAAMCCSAAQMAQCVLWSLGVEALLATAQEVNMSPEICQRAAVAVFSLLSAVKLVCLIASVLRPLARAGADLA